MSIKPPSTAHTNFTKKTNSDLGEFLLWLENHKRQLARGQFVVPENEESESSDADASKVHIVMTKVEFFPHLLC